MKDDGAPTVGNESSAATRSQDEADRERRLNALSELARSAKAAAPAAQHAATQATTRIPLHPPKPPRHLRGILLGALALLVVAAGVGVYLVRSHQQPRQIVTTPIPAILTIKT